MNIEAETSRYHGDTGWHTDIALFTQVAATPAQWLGQAGEHLTAAEILLSNIMARHAEIERHMQSRERREFKLQPSATAIYFLHCAFALENLFKGVMAARLSEEAKAAIARTGKLPEEMLSHDLIALATRVGYPLQKDSEFVLTFLKRYAVWAGRYPLPVKNINYGLTERLSGGNHYLTGGYVIQHVPQYLEFCGRVYVWARTAAGLHAPKGETGG